MPKLTDISIKHLLLPIAGQLTYDDDNSPLKVRVSQGGSKTFIVMLGSGRRHTIGRVGEVKLADAREAAKRLRAERTLGRILPTSVPVAEARKRYLAAINVRPATYAYYERYLNRLTGNLAQITYTDINRILDKLTPAARNQALASYRAFFSWCIERGHIDLSPCGRMSTIKLKSRERVLAEAELKAIWHACLDDSFGKIVRLLMITGQRRNEIAAVRSNWTKNDTLTIPANIAKNGEEHTIPLATNAQSLLAEASHVKNDLGMSRPNNTLLFPSGKTGDLVKGWNKLKAALDKRANVYGWTLHDLRRTFSTIHGQIGTPPHIIELLLNHKSGSMTPLAKTYNRYRYLPEMRTAMNAYEAHIVRVCSAM